MEVVGQPTTPFKPYDQLPYFLSGRRTLRVTRNNEMWKIRLWDSLKLHSTLRNTCCDEMGQRGS